MNSNSLRTSPKPQRRNFKDRPVAKVTLRLPTHVVALAVVFILGWFIVLATRSDSSADEGSSWSSRRSAGPLELETTLANACGRFETLVTQTLAHECVARSASKAQTPHELARQVRELRAMRALVSECHEHLHYCESCYRKLMKLQLLDEAIRGNATALMADVQRRRGDLVQLEQTLDTMTVALDAQWRQLREAGQLPDGLEFQ